MNPTILTWNAMEKIAARIDLVETMREAFRAYSNGEATIPPVGELQFADPPGDVHIKYGCLSRGTHYVVKIASGFYDNPQIGLPSSQGLMLLFSQRTGQLDAILLDEGHLTDLRTAAAGALAAQTLAPSEVTRIGILGTGTQARAQLDMLRPQFGSAQVRVWGRNPNRAGAFLEEIHKRGWTAETSDTPDDLAKECELIITSTPSREPLLKSDSIRPGTHITAVGSDIPEKQELEGDILARADVIVADSLSQCRNRGEIFRAISSGAICDGDAVELGEILAGRKTGRQSDTQITIADLTGVAVQDLAIASAVYRAYTATNDN